MAIIAVFILILYYYIFVIFEKNIKKPQNLQKDVVHLNNELSNGIQLKSNEFYDYDSGTIKGPYQYSVNYNDITNELTFTAHDNDFNSKNWQFPLLPNYYWKDGKIVEKDSCFNVSNNSNVKAEGKILFDYIQNNNLITDHQIGNVSKNKVFHSDRLFYFKCNNNKIESLHSCPSGTLLNDHIQCEKIHTCTGQPDNYKYPDENSKFKYFNCINEKANHTSCPPGEIFEFNQCIVPENLCEVRSDGFLQDIDRTSFLNCKNGKAILHHCPPYTYVLNGICENEVCENMQDNLVPIKNDNGTFEYASQYAECKKGRVERTLDCPTLWNHWETDVQIFHLPQVFDLNQNSCTKPILCENIKITNPNVIIPQYSYAKYLKNWGLSQIFDLLTGYQCDSNGNRIQVDVNPGELIINFQRTKIPSTMALKIPVKDSTKYFDVQKDTLENCMPNTFFDGRECKPKIPNSFTFKHLDIFKFDGLYINGWLDPNNIEYASKQFSCTGDYRPMDSVQACVHKDCTKYQFLHRLKGSIKVDDEYECFRKGKNIEKHKYNNPYNLALEFWNQRLTTKRNPSDNCTFGTNIKTGNFILDSTVYMTCDTHQPFVFCPSKLTETIKSVGNTFACSPYNSVYELVIPAKTTLLLYINEIAYIQIPNPTFVTINRLTLYLNTATLLDEREIRQRFNVLNISFHFKSDEPSTLYFKTLPTHPENVYIEKGNFRVNQVGIYDILYNTSARYVKDFQYHLENSVSDLRY